MRKLMGRKITTFLIDDNQYGPKTVEIGPWSGKAIYTPISYMPKIFNDRLEEFNNPGIYFLKSTSQMEEYSEKIYVGECENLNTRLRNHLSNPKLDFDECLVFISKNSMLTKIHFKYLESRCLEIVKNANTAELENTNKSNLPRLPEYDIPDLEIFLEQIEIILPLLGFMCFKPNTMNREESKKLNESIKNNKEHIYIIEKENPHIHAEMVVTEKGFIVLKGSSCYEKINPSLKEGRQKLKENLIKSKVLVPKGDVFVFDKDTIFKSPSESASVILGTQVSGPQTWKDLNGNTYLQNINTLIH